MTDNLNDVNLASIYSNLADIIATSKEDKNFNKILNLIKKEAAKGKYQIELSVDKYIYEWYLLPHSRYNKIIPDLAAKLEGYGFVLGSPEYNFGLFRDKYTIIVSWKK